MFKTVVRLTILSLAFWCCAPSLAAETKAVDMNPIDVSMFRLIANPEKYDGRLIRVVGFLSFGFEEDNIYPTRDAYSGADESSAVKCRYVGVDRTRAEALAGKHVIAVGVFHYSGVEMPTEPAAAGWLDIAELRPKPGR